MRRLVVGDIHGAYKALIQVLERVKFNPDTDLLIGIGDYVDGYPESKKVVQYLIDLKDSFIGITGNHDSWCKDWMKKGGQPPHIWTSQGGDNTLKSYNHKSDKEHLAFLESLPKYIELDNKLFVHGGYNPDIKETIEEQAIDKSYYDIESDLTWDRVLFMNMFYPREPWYKGDEGKNITYDKVFIGHTTTERIAKGYVPLFSDKVVAIDTGAGWAGKLTVMDIDTLEYWQSDATSVLYPEDKR